MVYLQWASVVLAGLSAVFWAWSSSGQIKKTTLGERKINSDFSDIIDPLNRQSKLNAAGSLCASLAAVCQALVLFLGTPS